MALMNELIETKPYSFEEAIKKHVWVNAMVEEYKSVKTGVTPQMN